MKYFKHILFLLLWSIVNGQWSMVNAQELEARVTINHTQIETTRTEVFDALQTKLTDFLNNHKWTEIPFRENEKIQCNFNITVNTYKQDENTKTSHSSSTSSTSLSIRRIKWTTTLWHCLLIMPI